MNCNMISILHSSINRDCGRGSVCDTHISILHSSINRSLTHSKLTCLNLFQFYIVALIVRRTSTCNTFTGFQFYIVALIDTFAARCIIRNSISILHSSINSRFCGDFRDTLTFISILHSSINSRFRRRVLARKHISILHSSINR